MKITNLDVEGYGVWTGLQIQQLADSLNVFYGPNEAGKTTLLQFIRSMLYGFSPERQQYLPPLHGGQPGGRIDIASPHGRFQIARYHATTQGNDSDQLTLTAPDGTRQGEHFVKVLLANVDEAVFNNVFAVGLREIQKLATLSDTEAAEMLYSLTAGLDRVSLVEVLGELGASRSRVLDAAGGPCQIVQLLAERERLCGEIEELGAINQRYSRLAAEHEQLRDETTRLEEESNRIARLLQVADLAVALRPRWAQRAALDEQLSALGSPRTMPQRAIERLDDFAARLQKHQQHFDQLGQQREELKREFASLAVNEALWRHAARIEALKEQEPWIAQLQTEIGELEKETAGLASELAAECQRLGLDADSSGPGATGGGPGATGGGLAATGGLSASAVDTGRQAVRGTRRFALPEALASLRSPARLLQKSRRQREEARRAAAAGGEAAETLSRQIESALASRGGGDLPAALEQAGNRVAQLRRRLQIDERLDQLAHHETELEEQERQWTNRQLLPIGALAGLGAVIVGGVVLILTGLLMPTTIVGSIGLTLVVLGVVGLGAGVGGKVLLEHLNASRLEACQRQLGVLRSQVEQTKADRDALDAQLPSGGGPVAVRLQAAQADLAVVEGLTPLDARRAAARQEADAAARRADEAREQYQAARRRWRQSLAAAGLPDRINVKQAHRLIERGDWLRETQQRLAERQDDLARRRRELDSLTTRIVQLATDAAVDCGPLSSRSPIDMLRMLSDAAVRQEAAVARRDAIRRDARRLRAAAGKHEDAVSRLKHGRRQLLIEAGVDDEQEFRRRALDCARADMLRQQRDAISREIEAAVAPHCSEEFVRQQLEGQFPGDCPDFCVSRAPTGTMRSMVDWSGTVPFNPGDTLEGRRAELGQRLAAVQAELHGLLEKRGRLSEQIEALAADNRLASKHLDLAMIECRLEAAIHRWQVLATACRVLDLIRDAYQRHRQPETLQEASSYLDRLTQGRYRRVWTPLGEHALRVDDAEGRALPVEALSRGTREQLFLSLRLALAASYARRGAPLPLVLDDVLVNFDDQRAKAAATVLRDFADAGHQLLVFTCHEHIFKLFKSLKAPVSRLPGNSAPAQIVMSLESRGEEKPPREKAPRAPRRKAAAKQEPPPDDAMAEADDSGANAALWDEDGGDGHFDDDAAAA